MTFNELIQHFGSQAAVARALGVSPAAVSQWAINGVPKLRQYQARAIIEDAAKSVEVAP